MTLCDIGANLQKVPYPTPPEAGTAACYTQVQEPPRPLAAQRTTTRESSASRFSWHTHGGSPRACSFPALSPQAFSFNSPQGMCEDCNGLGTQVAFDPDLMIPDKTLSLQEGALKPIGRIQEDNQSSGSTFHRQVFNQLKIPLNKPWNKLTKAQQNKVLNGTGETRYTINWGSHGLTQSRHEGLLNRLMRRFRNTRSEGMKRWYSQFLANTPCSSCNGVRLRPESAAVRVADRTIVDISSLTIDQTADFFGNLKAAAAQFIGKFFGGFKFNKAEFGVAVKVGK